MIIAKESGITVQALFKIFDEDDSGEITPEELHGGFGGLGCDHSPLHRSWFLRLANFAFVLAFSRVLCFVRRCIETAG